MVQLMRELIRRYATRQGAALAIAGAASALLLLITYARGSAPPDGDGLITGAVRVVDGDTLVVGGVRVRLEGIDAPEADQTCGRADGGAWACGREATERLSMLVSGRNVTCAPKGLDKYSRVLGRCYAGDIEINAYMVRNGLAWAFVRYSQEYVEIEAEARRQAMGIWQGPAQPAWEYRASRWAAHEPEMLSGCVIKGNISRRGRIYHLPGDPYYERTRIDEGRGERWFCSEGEAAAAGWRAAGRAH
jgi:endonuclease YncB( thermonuclease family)